MRTRPVFESYSSFVNSLYNTINEELTPLPFDEFVSGLDTFLDDKAEEAFRNFKKCATLSPIVNYLEGNNYAYNIEEELSDFSQKIQKVVKDSTSSSLKISGTTQTEIKSFKYENVVNGQIKLNADLSSLGVNMGMNSADSETLESGKFSDMYTILSVVNYRNLQKIAANNKPGAIEGKKKKMEWQNTDGKVDTTGAPNQYVISDVSAGLNFGSTSTVSPISQLDSPRIKPNSLSDSKVYKTLVLYGFGEYIPVDPSTGNSIPKQVIKTKLVEIPGTAKEYEQVIDGGTGMFAQNESGVDEIKEENKDKISNILGAILAPLAGIPESITITGGASFEGTLDNNKKLVVQRAKAVKSLFESLYPELIVKGTSVVKAVDDDFSKIQPKDEPAKYPEWRKVYIKVKGVLKSDTKVEEKTFVVDEDNPAGSVVINQYLISFEYTDSSLTA